MRILTISDALAANEQSVVTVGNFDGVHRGHQTLLKEIVIRAAAEQRKSVVVTFEPHTRLVTQGDATGALLTTFEEKARLFEQLNVDYCMRVPFNESMKERTAEAFIDEVLVQKLHMVLWVMGRGHGIGRNRTGDEFFLRERQGKYHFTTFVADLLTRDGIIISSTQIRECIVQGRIAEAVVMLGHPYLISVERTQGRKLGKKLGYPTLNFKSPPSQKVIPPPGVYTAEMEHKGWCETGVLYFGDCPTLRERREAQFEFFSFNRGHEEIPEGDTAQLWLYSFIRMDRSFDGTDELTVQIGHDVEKARTFFDKEKSQWR